MHSFIIFDLSSYAELQRFVGFYAANNKNWPYLKSKLVKLGNIFLKLEVGFEPTTHHFADGHSTSELLQPPLLVLL
jgi:hypothetical protein